MEEEKEKRNKCQHSDVFKRSELNMKLICHGTGQQCTKKGMTIPEEVSWQFCTKATATSFHCLPARTQLPPQWHQGQWKATFCPLHGLHNSAQLPLHCPLGMEMSQLQPPENLLGGFQAIVRSHWQQTSRLFFLVQKQNKYLIYPWFYFIITDWKHITCKYGKYLT